MAVTDSIAARGSVRTARGERSRAAILSTAARLATVEGLEGLSIGRLAAELGMSKSGLYAHFGSKEELQLATIDAALKIYEHEIVRPALKATPGRERLLTLCDRFFDYVERGVFPGGCFFVFTALDPAIRREPVRARLADGERAWLKLLERQASRAIEAGEIGGDLTARQIAVELDAVMMAADANFVLLGDASFLEEGRAAVRRRLAPI